MALEHVGGEIYSLMEEIFLKKMKHEEVSFK